MFRDANLIKAGFSERDVSLAFGLTASIKIKEDKDRIEFQEY